MEINYNWFFFRTKHCEILFYRKKNISKPLPWKMNLGGTTRGLVLGKSNSKSISRMFLKLKTTYVLEFLYRKIL